MKPTKHFFLLIAFCIIAQILMAQKLQANMSYSVSMENAATHYYHVVLHCKKIAGETQDFKMCAWTPGYYQIIDFAKAVENFHATDAAGKDIQWEKSSANTWRVHSNKAGLIVLTYDVKALVPFVGNVYLDETRGYITPGGLFLYLDIELRKPVTVQMKP